jgi:imidazole glycerol-phosphate synthase subunit HisH
VIAIVDYGLGNLASVRNAFHAVGGETVLTSDPETIRTADGIVVPGVGAARAGMAGLRSRGLVDVVVEAARSGTPVLGHCLGMQLLFDESEENGGTACLGLLPGTVRRMRSEFKIPHIGWNQIKTSPSPMWEGLPPQPYFYFVHSYVCVPDQRAVIAGATDYGETFCSAVVRGNIWGAQFHPERSGTAGLTLIRNFIRRCGSQSGTHPAVLFGENS